MADVTMPESVPCKFDEKGYSPCRKPSTNGWCSKHESLKCVSCGEHAIRSCEEGISLTCGQALCRTCQHNPDGPGHVTKRVYDELTKERREFESTGKESKRMLAKRGVPTDIELPCHLEELLRSTPKGFGLKVCYHLQLEHGMMGTFPAILSGTETVFLTDDKESAIRVWKSMSPRKSAIIEDAWMTRDTIGVAYRMQSDKTMQWHSCPTKLFSKNEIEAILAQDGELFRWAPGISGTEISKSEFDRLIEKAAA